MGDPAGIGPEITTKAWRRLRKTSQSFYVIAEPSLYPDALIIDRPNQATQLFAKGLPVLPLNSTINRQRKCASNAKAILASIEQAYQHCAEGEAAALVTNPIAKDILYQAGFSHAGHTEFLAHLDKAPLPVMMLSAQGLRVALLTIHIALRDIAAAITPDKISQTVRILHHALQTDFGIANPRIALAGLNPHAGENGAMGREEIDILNPTADTLRAQGIAISAARPADTLFHAEARQGYDAVLAMYHDQGLIPVKSLDFYTGVNTTLGLTIIRTSPDHGTAFDIAGTGTARPDSLIAAIKAAGQMAENRAKNRAEM